MKNVISKERKNAIHVILSRKSAKLLRIKWKNIDEDAAAYGVRKLKKQLNRWVSVLSDDEKEYVLKHKTLEALKKEIDFLLEMHEIPDII